VTRGSAGQAGYVEVAGIESYALHAGLISDFCRYEVDSGKFDAAPLTG
jgi:hypothetical protein